MRNMSIRKTRARVFLESFLFLCNYKSASWDQFYMLEYTEAACLIIVPKVCQCVSVSAHIKLRRSKKAWNKSMK